ncbi:tetratricopeptide repeat protein [Streptomyces sp. NPDC058284]|uniref:tetratricopeptide repeat protein n=1 Tax=unclassified Streptomyces TaxID=2593676 RepID=UPI0036596334
MVGDVRRMHVYGDIASAGSGYLRDPARWLPVREWEPYEAGVHRAHPSRKGRALPAYVPRDMDAVIRAQWQEALDGGGFMYLVGEGAAGATRAAFEAVRALAADRRVLAPRAPGHLALLADRPPPPTRRAPVIWLDGLERFLVPDGLCVEVLGELVRARFPVIATLDALSYEALTAPRGPGPRHLLPGNGWAARVLNYASPIRLARHWTSAEVARARLSEDGQVREATRCVRAPVAEYLAAGPALWSRWENGRRAGENPRGAALVTAAVDLARAGLTGPYSRQLLIDVHRFHLADQVGDRAVPEGPDDAFAWAARPARHTVGLLNLVSPDLWQPYGGLADAVRDDAEAPGVHPFVWFEALANSADIGEAFHIALNASESEPTVARFLWTALVDAGVARARVNLGALLLEQGRYAEAETVCREAAREPETRARALFNLALVYAGSGRPSDAYETALRALEAGVRQSWALIGQLRAESGDVDGAVEATRRAVGLGVPNAAYNLAGYLAEAGHFEEAVDTYRDVIASGDLDAYGELGLLLERLGRSAVARRVYREGIAAGRRDLWLNLGNLFNQEARHEEACGAFESGGRAGDTRAWFNLGNLHGRQGRHRAAVTAYRAAIDAGDPHGLHNLGLALERLGCREEAEEAWRPAAARGDPDALLALADLAEKAGHRSRAMTRYERAADAGSNEALYCLGALTILEGRSEDGERLVRRAAAADNVCALVHLGILATAQGRDGEGQHFLRRALASDRRLAEAYIDGWREAGPSERA